LYAKVYAGPPVLDSLAGAVALELVPSLPQGVLAGWFFVPYADPEPHLRLRFRGDPSALLTHVLPALERVIAPARATGAVYRLQLDTYERELERYGGELGIELAEQVFHWDSEACARVLALYAERAELRWTLALLGVERLSSDFIPELEQRARFVDGLLGAYRRELAVALPTLQGIGSRYRPRAERLQSVLWPACDVDPDSDVERARAIYAQRSERLAPIAERARCLLASDPPELGPGPALASLMHMHVVRLLGTRARSHELVMYDFLHRQYASHRARAAAPRRTRVG
jgi:thiopeptide-type bacteriocin biosynthesis protein